MSKLLPEKSDGERGKRGQRGMKTLSATEISAIDKPPRGCAESGAIFEDDGKDAYEGIKTGSITCSIIEISAIGAQYERMRNQPNFLTNGNGDYI